MKVRKNCGWFLSCCSCSTAPAPSFKFLHRAEEVIREGSPVLPACALGPRVWGLGGGGSHRPLSRGVMAVSAEFSATAGKGFFLNQLIYRETHNPLLYNYFRCFGFYFQYPNLAPYWDLKCLLLSLVVCWTGLSFLLLLKRPGMGLPFTIRCVQLCMFQNSLHRHCIFIV